MISLRERLQEFEDSAYLLEDCARNLFTDEEISADLYEEAKKIRKICSAFAEKVFLTFGGDL